MLVDYLQKAADYCHLKQPLLGMTDAKAVHNVQEKVAGGKLLRFRFGKTRRPFAMSRSSIMPLSKAIANLRKISSLSQLA